MPLDKIVVRGARQHNLKNIDVDIPRNRLVVTTGISGSGKSTLAFDTLYAEGQRRYVESLSAYARQFLEQMDKPDVDSIEGLAPAIAIEQKSITKNPRSTVGTVTEIYDYLRLLFARIGKPHCHRCGQRITSQSTQEIVDQVMALETGTRVVILSPVVAGQKGAHQRLLQRLQKDGFARVRVDGKLYELDGTVLLDKNIKHSIEVVVDRLVVQESARNRLADSIELAIGLSEGVVLVDLLQGEPLIFSEKAVCMLCGISYSPFTPAGFSFNSPQGACRTCDGLGSMMVFDPDLIVPDPTLSLRDGVIVPWENRHSVYFYQVLDAITRQFSLNIHTPFNRFPEALIDLLLHGSKGKTIEFYLERDGRRYTYSRPFEGVIPNLERRYRETRSHHVREDVERFMNMRPCPECHGARLKPESLAVEVGGESVHKVCRRSVTELLDFFGAIALGSRDRAVADPILKEITERLCFLTQVGLGYLTLDRASATLSAGEGQRIRLATQIGSKLTGVLYVLDEPSVGLHQRDNQRLLSTLKQMRDLGNTVLVVEHDAETILSADHVIDMGPGAGADGGYLVFDGPPSVLLEHETSVTGKYLSGRKTIPVPARRRPMRNGHIVVEEASTNNLKDITVRFPLGCFVCVTGVSGSGKSSLVVETLYRSLARRFYHLRKAVGRYSRMTGLEKIDSVINVDQSPIGRTPRSNPATYTGVFTDIRDLFAKTPDARTRGYRPGRFSFNVKGGRCEACRGDGIIKIEMHFLPDVYVTCDVCQGKRYNRETLDIKYKGKNISEVLDMTVDQALGFFGKIKKIRTKLQALADVGLGYIRVGQPATTLSGGEAQRVKLSRELSKRATGRTVFILDEPTTGLHFADIQKLLDVLGRLTDAGNTIIVIEHNMDVIKSADYIVDLGPEGGDKGGYVVKCGTPEEIAGTPASHTGRFLSKVLGAE
ncbi:MAG: excinuclease ABC subunit A [Desulfobacterales bacterium C00003060]|nr:MAG: excinuclease ABC subunit A [Desulfobacterales bacterium S3730MH5]OEU79771.1 MAG: excinuclease ABC subunit A [Desulfobacterales bacterium C00003060]